MPRPTLHRRSTLLAVALVAGAVVLVAVVRSVGSPGDGTSSTVASVPPTTGTAPPVIVPGRPGEESEIRPGTAIVVDPPQYNTVDTWYVQMMIPHHTQAVQMAALAQTRTEDPGVRAFADRIRSGQAAEIDVLKGWLQVRGLPDGDHDHATMPGMQTEAAIRDLAAARGTAFDRLFVTMMTDHHEGAVEMSHRVLTGGTDLAVEELATAIAAEQAAEITRMRDLVDG
ncbi:MULTISPECIES: DUF305 domain-containing protein [unclassified Solwaraspora]|uniref:DUF305 domain-containing protein n=1 Tax=unclassified Solwaraspora TaxID=2627926 RepID=UPI00259B6F0E|nr:DUF305 domain-containing protein [Solwaraspora sp. WMMA2056]WJK39045.1 DUF305 domain-containing protein [Solwaraspora sp. WMMA2056]